MQIKLSGLVVMEASLGERDKIITILTSEQGLVKAIIKGAKSMLNKNMGATQLLSYSQFVLYKGRSGYIVDDSEIQEVFFDLRSDIKKVALAQYFCDLSLALSSEGGEARDFLRLMLNGLEYLSKDKRSIKIIKSVVELKAMALAGYMPDLVCCKECGGYEDNIVYFSFASGNFVCSKCRSKAGQNHYIRIKMSVLTALRHIIYVPFNKIFNFKLSDESLKELSEVAENYTLMQLGRNFKTLDFFKILNSI